MAEILEYKRFLVLCTLFVLFVGGALSQSQCTTSPNGTIIWGPLPPLRPTTSDLDYETDGERRSTLSDMARGFVNIVTPPAKVSSLLDHLVLIVEPFLEHTPMSIDPWSEFQTLASILVGIVVCLSLGVAYIVLVLVVGMIFGCCRCCNNCGGKRVQEDSRCPGCLRVFYTVFLLCVTGVLCAGMAYTNFSNDFIGYAYKKTEPASINAIGDVQSFMTDTVNQLEYITDDQYGMVDCLIRRDINNIGDVIAGPLVEYLKTDAGVQDAMDAFGALTSNLSATYMALENINSSRTLVVDGTSKVEESLIAVKAILDGLVCTGCPDSANLAEVANYDALPPRETELGKALDAKSLADGFYTDFENALSNISKSIDDSSKSAVTEVETLLDDIKKTVSDGFVSISDSLDVFNTTLNDLKNSIKTLFDTADNYEDYRYYGLIGVTCLTLLVVLFNVIGIAMGTFSYKDVLPTERSRLSNAGGNVLIAGVFFSILFGPILMFICFALFAVSGTTTLTCEPFNTYEIFEKTIDKPGFGGSGYYLADQLFGNSSIELKASSVLTECEQDTSIYSALQLSNLFSLDSVEKQLTGAKKDVLDTLQKEIKVPDLNLVPEDLSNQLDTAVGDINLGGIDPSIIETVLSRNVTTENLTEFAVGVRAAIANNPVNASDLEDVAVELERIQREEVEPVNDQKMLIVGSANKLPDLNTTLSVSIANTVAASDAVEDKVNLPATEEKVQNISVDYVNQVFGYADQYLAKVNTQLDEDVAKCKPMWEAYHAGVSLLCYYIFDSLNTLWFTTGWCAIFILPSIFVAVRLAKYYRIMDEAALPRNKKKKGASTRGRRVNQDVAMEDLPENGHHSGHDNIRLVESLGQGGMQPQQNPQYIPDDVINGYDGYNNLGRPMAPPPAYHPGEPLNIPPHDYYF